MRQSSKRENPIVAELSEQLRVERELFLRQETTSSLNSNLLLLTGIFDGSEYSKEIDEVASNYTKESLPKGGAARYVEVCLWAALALRSSRRIPGHIKKYMKDNFGSFISSGVSVNTKGLGLYLLNEVDKNIVYSNAQQIKDLSVEILRKKGVQAQIDFVFGLSPQLIDGPISISNDDLSGWPLERLSKYIIFTIAGGSLREDDINLLDNKIRESLRANEPSSIRLSLFQASKMINSNIPPQHLNDILAKLKSVNAEWSQLIDEFKDGGVLVNLDGLDRVPSYSPNNDVWAYIAAIKSGLDTTYYVQGHVYERYYALVEADYKKLRTIKPSSFVVVVLVTIGLSIANTFAYLRVDMDLMQHINSILDLELISSAETIRRYLGGLMGLIINPLAFSVISVWYLARLYGILLSKGVISWAGYLSAIPLVDKLIDKIQLR